MRGLWFLTLLLLPLATFGQSATINWTNVHQQMDGFGGQTWNSADNLTSAEADMYFSPTAGIGLAYVRTVNTSDGSIPDLVALREAVARGAKVELSLQSPPASMKVSGSFTNGTGGIITSDYAEYAAYIVNWINTLAANGVPVAVLSVQNEPDLSSSSLGACVWTAAQFDTFVGTYLGPALASAGLSPQVMLGEVSTWFSPDLVTTSLEDPTAEPYISIVAVATPWITSSSLNLASQSSVSVSSNSFTYILPADSVTTLVGNPQAPTPAISPRPPIVENH
jgi:glucuronoarabinoxylan endo-1,4-beta-xylanase